MQYTIRGIPPEVNNALRARARAAGKSLNQAAITALAEGTGVTGTLCLLELADAESPGFRLASSIKSDLTRS